MTRAASASTASGSRTWLTSVWPTTASKLAAGKSSSWASPTTNSTRSPTPSLAASRSAAAMNSGLWSIPVTVPANLARGDRARDDAGAAAEVQDGRGARQVDEVQIGLAVATNVGSLARNSSRSMNRSSVAASCSLMNCIASRACTSAPWSLLGLSSCPVGVKSGFPAVTSGVPADGRPRVGVVCAERAGVDGEREVAAQLGMLSSRRRTALRTALVTLARARSLSEAARRSRPPRPRARASSRVSASSSPSARAVRSRSFQRRACSISASSSAIRSR